MGRWKDKKSVMKNAVYVHTETNMIGKWLKVLYGHGEKSRCAKWKLDCIILFTGIAC